ncbi:MAG: hypothetical protein IPG80_21990 [Anaerolineales bacterium]|jgi:hypothetical protein|uniref:hypothetical protein n=1 Tax=Candidatus Villigracilis vicinus TaxID=3140679 RepID=UPI0031346B91|nr:hypothetical protein [Anaerolineales bacterium]MBK7449335.1 hypothetical protein [Anaerolineales bacterium]MBK9779795.1 hypothetical protein [Anaerolineales bacterium]
MDKLKKRTRETYQARILVARIMFYVNFALWIIVGILYVAKMIQDQNGLSAALVGFFFLFSAMTLFIAARMLDQREKWSYITILVLTILNLLLTFTGYPDFTYILATLFDIIILTNLIPLKPFYDIEA